MDTLKYFIKRVLLMFLTFFIIMSMLFILVRLLPNPIAYEPGSDSFESEMAWRENWGYNKPIIVQYGIFLKNLFTKFDWGVSTKMYHMKSVTSVVFDKLPPTMLVNFLAMIVSVPLGLLLGAFAALKKNKWQDQVISVGTMIFISIPSYVSCFLIQFLLCATFGWFPIVMEGFDNIQELFSWDVIYSLFPAVLALATGTVAGFTRTTRAELTEVLTGEYMLLARTKGLTRWQATIKHAFRNSMVIIVPMIMGEVISILGGSLIVENVFSIPGVGSIYISAIGSKDYNVFLFVSLFYVFIGLLSAIIVDISYGFIDPRIRVGGRK